VRLLDARVAGHQGNVGKFADAILPVDRTFNYDDRILITPLGTTPDGAMRVRVEVRELVLEGWIKVRRTSHILNGSKKYSLLSRHDHD